MSDDFSQTETIVNRVWSLMKNPDIGDYEKRETIKIQQARAGERRFRGLAAATGVIHTFSLPYFVELPGRSQ